MGREEVYRRGVCGSVELSKLADEWLSGRRNLLNAMKRTGQRKLSWLLCAVSDRPSLPLPRTGRRPALAGVERDGQKQQDKFV